MPESNAKAARAMVKSTMAIGGGASPAIEDGSGGGGLRAAVARGPLHACAFLVPFPAPSHLSDQ